MIGSLLGLFKVCFLFVDWLVGFFKIYLLVGWFIAWYVCWFFGWLLGLLIGCFIACFFVIAWFVCAFDLMIHWLVRV